MASKVNAEVLKKHHFWILAGLIPVLVLVAVILIWSGAGGAIGSESKKISDQLQAAQGKQPKGTWLLGKLDEQKKIVASKKDTLWQFNWDDQKSIFTWPKDRDGKLAKFLLDPTDPNYTKNPAKADMLKFGAPLPDDNFQYTAFTDSKVYEEAYRELAKTVEPTQFINGWQGTLRYVRNWTEKKPESWMLWLALEDYWIQKGALLPIKDVTDAVAAFTPLPGPDGKPVEGLKKSFRSKLWDLELEIKSDGPKRIITGKIRNITDRVQLLGIGNVMKLQLYFDDNPVPVDYRVEGEFIEAGKQVAINYVPIFHDLPVELDPKNIVKVVQVFDARTVPVKRIDGLIIGKTGNRHFAANLKTPGFVPADPVAAIPGGDTGDGGAPGGAPAGVGGGRGLGPPPGGTGSPDGGMPGGPPGSGMAMSGLEAIFAPMKYRYLDTSEQVRRVPVAVVLVVDSFYLQDVLTAYSNSKLRFQIAQIHYKRFRDKLALPQPGGVSPYGPGGGTGNFGMGGGIMFGGGMRGDDDMGAPGGPPAGAGGPGATPPRGQLGGGPGGPPAGIIPGGPPAGIGGPGGLGGGIGIEGMGGGLGSGFGGGFLSTGVADSQTSAGLVEITIYGVISLYERVPKAPSGSDPANPTPAEAPMGTPMVPDKKN